MTCNASRSADNTVKEVQQELHGGTWCRYQSRDYWVNAVTKAGRLVISNSMQGECMLDDKHSSTLISEQAHHFQ